MDIKLLARYFFSAVIGAFIAGVISLTFIDSRVTANTDPKFEIVTCDIQAAKTERTALANELRAKADLATFSKYDHYFETINKDLSDLKGQLAYIQGQLGIKDNKNQ